MSKSMLFRGNEKIIISLTSIRSRENCLKETLICLLNQDFDFNYEVRVYLSKEPYLLDEGYDEEPHWVNEISGINEKCNLKIFFVENTGPYRKLVPVLKEYFLSGLDAIIITCDDDVKYDRWWLKNLIAVHCKVGGIVAYRGHSIKMEDDGQKLASYKIWQINKNKKQFCLSNLPTGKDGVLYRPYYFRKEVVDMSMAMSIAPTADDLWFRWNTIVNAVPCYLITLSGKVFSDVSSFVEENSLWEEFNKKGGNDKTIEKLEVDFKKRIGFNIFDVLEFFFGKKDGEIGGCEELVNLCRKNIYSTHLGEDAPESFRCLNASTYELIRYSLLRRINSNFF